MLSFAQNGEDVVLARAFNERTDGFYIDVGAWAPDQGSVTKHFYDRGWCGINVEPSRRAFALLCAERVRDVNLNVCLSDRAGEATFYEGVESERSTLSPKVVALAANLRFDARGTTVRTLADVCAEHAPGHIDFLKIDVEGHEAEVIAGADWVRWRPVVVLVEAVEPGVAIPSQTHWEHHLLAADYDFALFDGINRFYVRSEDRALISCLSAPANPLDRYVPYYHQRIVDELRATQLEVRRLREEVRLRDQRIQQLEGVR
jgi:FkbM family methyltransferase